MILLENVTMHYGAKVLFDAVNISLKDNEKYGVIGANGAGKSTLFKLIQGIEEPNTGSIQIAKGQKIGFLKQDQFKYENDRIIDVIIQGNQELWHALQEKDKILEKEDITDDEGFKLAELEIIIADNDGYDVESRAEIILEGLGISKESFREPLNTLSGGYKIRVLLGQSLFGKPDILLLDEPNNHLDILSIQWLEDYLINEFKGTLLLISHDHDFLNRVCPNTLDIDYKNITFYPGNYDYFVQNKQDVAEQTRRERENIEKRIKKDQIFIERFRASASRSRQALSREKHIQKIELPEIKNTSRIAANFIFKQEVKSGKEALLIENLSKSFEERIIFNNVSVRIDRGEKIAILGKNGIGKSTFLKTILNLINPDKGSITWGHNAKYSYFSQDHHDLVKGNYTAFEWLSSLTSVSEISVLRQTLGQMLFSQDEVNKSLSVLSGGEAARLIFANIILQKSNIMILDEPTNHLDLESRISLAKALKNFEGTVLSVTHDRGFISAFATRILFLHEKGVIDFKGNYEEFKEKYSKFFFHAADNSAA
jgi:ATPase subunit of ABC transporter with duplicated ATPase domains